MGTSERIVAILKALGYTPATLSKATTIPPSKAKKIFSGNTKIRYDEFIEICHLTGLSPDTLCRGVSQ